MEAKDLRIGNLFLEESSKETVEVIGLEKNRIIFSGMFLNNWQSKPIPLTEEWKDRIKDNKDLLIDASGFVIFKNGYAYQFVFKDYPFVHSIQNLYFVLTGEELTLQQCLN